MSTSANVPKRLIVAGPPASGKGTQGRRLAEEFGLAYLSTGAMLREHVEAQSDVGRLAKPILDRGGYLPDDLMCQMVGAWLGKVDGGWVLDGFPRSVVQAAFLDHWLADRGLSLDAAVALDAPYEVLSHRIRGRVECPDCRWSGGDHEIANDVCPQCGGQVEARADDTEENFKSRYDNYMGSAMPVVGHYRSCGVLCACDATLPRDEVTLRLMRMLTSEKAG